MENVRESFLARYFCIDKNIDKSSTQKYMQSIVDEMLPKGKAAEFNEGTMELGALICKPTNPKCDICPVKKTIVDQEFLMIFYPIL